MGKGLISIIVPMYNSEKFIARCIESIISQSFDNYELLLIDDGSTDNTKNICNNYIKNNIRYFYKKNGGVSSARNFGLHVSKGEYVCFLDSDDWYDSLFLEKMIKKIKNGNYDVCCCNGKFVYATREKKINNHFSNKKFIENYFLDKIKSITCSFLIKKSLIENNHIFFSEDISWGEDFEFFSTVLLNSSKITYIRDHLFYLNTVTNDNRLSAFKINKIDDDKVIIERLLKNNSLNKNLKKCLLNYRLPALIIYRLTAALDKKIKDNHIRYYYHLYNNYINDIKFCNGLRSMKLFISKYKLERYINNTKIGILTLCGNSNFGNKLQNYALINVIEKLGYKVETIWVENPFLGSPVVQILRCIKHFINDYIVNYKRNIFFIRFNKYLNLSPKKILFNNSINRISNNYGVIISGSDQVWNDNCSNNFNIYLMKNIKSKKISYSASFGKNNVSTTYLETYKNALLNFDMISVRENRGKEIVEELTGRNDIKVHVDPTMLLHTDEWDKIIVKPKQLDDEKVDKYILNYFLGELSESRKRVIDKLAKENNCHIINILDKKDPFYEIGPREFLFLEKNAFLICTDSFHSCVFALLFNRPFVVFDREQKGVENMNSRIDTLINKFNLKDRKYNGKNITKNNLNHDYTDAYKILEDERKKSNDFLKKALDIE